MKATIEIILCVLISYLIMAFLKAEIDFNKWKLEDRAISLVLLTLGIFICNIKKINL